MSMKSFKQFFNEDCGHCAEDHPVSDEEVVSVEEWVQRLEELRETGGEEFESIAARIEEIIEMITNNEVDQGMLNELERDYQRAKPELVDQLNQPGAPVSSDKWMRVHGG